MIEILRRLESNKDNLELRVIAGNSIQDFATYKQFVGQIYGLNQAIEICKQYIREEQ